ncbi:non-homologous end joining protein Ku [Cohnella xylanilytica]|uniref:non-homologous end joining protein Ku n=1 Tax=Cohnella xylanilytica TaxID=557555 RepID=UPI001B2F389E|nr:Ku protein [Cohnella xylanilytica]GIO12626.1 non-homologous end joining protein Ku [Cohnella xylanilytica]
MHAMWKGTLQIAKFQVPIKLYAAAEDKEIALKTAHRECGGPISHLRYCQTCQTAVEAGQIRRIYDLGGGNRVEIEEGELKAISPPASRSFVVEQFVREDEIEPVYLKKHYYVGSDEVGEEAYRLVHRSLRQAGKAGIGFITLRSVRSLAALRPTRHGIVMSTMHYADEVRANPAYREEGREETPATDDLSFVFQQLVGAMTAPFDGARYVNRYNEALKRLIDGKIADRVPAAPEWPEADFGGGRGADLLSSLRRSLDFVAADSLFAEPNPDQPGAPH